MLPRFSRSRAAGANAFVFFTAGRRIAVMFRRSETPAVISTNYAGFARELSHNLDNSAALMLDIQERCRVALREQKQAQSPEPNLHANRLVSDGEHARLVADSAFVSLESQCGALPQPSPSLKGRAPPACPQSPLSFPTRRRPGQAWAWEA